MGRRDPAIVLGKKGKSSEESSHRRWHFYGYHFDGDTGACRSRGDFTRGCIGFKISIVDPRISTPKKNA
jgi:hypothetical protein